MKLKYGVVGFSSGNGHPFSWSIACNGYSDRNLSRIPFKRVRDYLPKYNLNLSKIDAVEVTHVWTQNLRYSELIAKTCKIKTVCKNIEELASSVDAILLLRDDIILREKYLNKLIKYGKPILVDKFIHFDSKKLKKFLKNQIFQGQLFSESPLIHNKKIILNKKEKNQIGKIKLINASVSGSWIQYSIHIIEPVLRMLKNKKILKISSTKTKNSTSVTLKWSDNLITVFNTIDGVNFIPFTEIIGTKSCMRINWDFDYVLDDFISSLKSFTYAVKNKRYIKKDKHHNTVARILNAGR
tara:strand:- start:287 stop:1177 length:891 start_codon:yes stop_codon:yes gene_type:complete